MRRSVSMRAGASARGARSRTGSSTYPRATASRSSFVARFALAGALLVAVVCVVPAAAEPGALDPSFAGKGWVRTYELNGPAFSHGATDIALQRDGKILAVGPADAFNSIGGFAVFRYTHDGKFDRSFGQGGWA